MTPLNPPPYVPPTPDSSRRSCLIVTAVAVIGFFIAIGAIGFGMYKVKQMAESDPVPLPGYGKPKLVKKLADGWGLYSFPELGYRIELPSKPKPEEPQWEPGQSLLLKGWSNYTVELGLVGVELDGYEFRLPYTLEEVAEEQKEVYAREKALKDVQSETKSVQVGGKDALLQTFTYVIDDAPMVAKVYSSMHKNLSLSLRFHHEKLLPEEFTKDLNRIVKSVEFEP